MYRSLHEILYYNTQHTKSFIARHKWDAKVFFVNCLKNYFFKLVVYIAHQHIGRILSRSMLGM